MTSYPLIPAYSPPFEMGKATRDAYGEALAEIADSDARIVALDADLSKSTKSAIFAKKHPHRFFNFGISEANMVSVAAGFAASGKIPFASSFACFLTCKSFDQMRISVALSGFNVKLVGSHGGISVGEDGPSQQSIEDFALMCSLPGFVVLNPADEIETKLAVRAAWEHFGPVYLRTGRPKAPRIYREPFDFVIGRANLLREGSDVTLIGTGLMVAEALKAAHILAEKHSVSARVLDFHTLKPLDRDAIADSALRTGAFVVAEEHLINGGLGAAVAQAVAEIRPVPIEFVALRNTYAESGTPEELFKKYHLTAEDIVSRALSVIARKGRSERVAPAKGGVI
jgi:transketolase